MKPGIINIAAQSTIVKTSTDYCRWSMCNKIAGHSPANIFDLSHPAEDLNQQGGPQSQRDHDMKKYPKEFNDWYHKNTKDYKLGGQPDPNLDEPYQDWLDLGKPRAITTPAYDWNSIRNRVSAVTGLTGAGLTIYLIISEGSRLFPPRNLILIP